MPSVWCSSATCPPPPPLLMQASRYARAKRVVLKGDLPIGVDKRSADTWLEPRLFRMEEVVCVCVWGGGGAEF